MVNDPYPQTEMQFKLPFLVLQSLIHFLGI